MEEESERSRVVHAVFEYCAHNTSSTILAMDSNTGWRVSFELHLQCTSSIRKTVILSGQSCPKVVVARVRAEFDARVQAPHHLAEPLLGLFHFYNEQLFNSSIPYRPCFLQFRNSHFDTYYVSKTGRKLGDCKVINANTGSNADDVIGITLYTQVGWSVPTRDYVSTLLHECIHAHMRITGKADKFDDHGPLFRKEVTRTIRKLRSRTFPSRFSEINLYPDDVLSSYFSKCGE